MIALDGARQVGLFLGVKRMCYALNALLAAGIERQLWLIIKSHTKAIMSCFGMRITGKDYARLATTGRPRRKMAALGISRE
jgi:hypothetical protein